MRKIPKQPAYIIEEEGFGKMTIMNTISAWWSDSNTLVKIMRASRNGKTLKRALAEAGVTKKQWRYFVEIHPDAAKWRREYKWVKRREEMNLAPRLLLDEMPITLKPGSSSRLGGTPEQPQIPVKKIVEPKQRAQDLIIIDIDCPACGTEMKIAVFPNDCESGAEKFSDAEARLARKHGVKLKNVSTEWRDAKHLASVCEYCGAPVDNDYILSGYFTEALNGNRREEHVKDLAF